MMEYNIRKGQSQVAEYTAVELAKWLNAQMPSLLEQMCIRTFGKYGSNGCVFGHLTSEGDQGYSVSWKAKLSRLCP